MQVILYVVLAMKSNDVDLLPTLYSPVSGLNIFAALQADNFGPEIGALADAPKRLWRQSRSG